MKKQLSVILNLFFVLIFLSYPIIFSPDLSKNIFQLFTIRPFLLDFLHYVSIIIFFYINYYFLVPKLYFSKKYLIFVISIVLFLFTIVILPNYLLKPITHHHQIDNFEHREDFRKPPPTNSIRDYIIQRNSSYFLLFFFSFVLSLMLKMRGRLKKNEHEKIVSELTYLKAQINPHFLFNTLNSIYNLSLEKSEFTPNAILKLSDLMRFSIDEASKNFITLEQEINYLTD